MLLPLMGIAGLFLHKGETMIQGIYTASMGMTPLMDKQDQIANNLANINTTGFKQSGLFLKSYQKYLENDAHEPNVNSEIKPDEVYIDYSEGPMRQTNSPLDLCIKGSGFFSVMTSDGVQYTRNGNFSLDSEGLLVTSDGSKVLGKDGYIRVEKEYPVSVNEKGEVVQNGQVRGTLKIVDFNKPYKLLRCGESRFKPEQTTNAERVSDGFVVKEGYLEASNVNIIRSMVDMISTYRNYEADQRALLAQDETLNSAVNTVGKLS
jgi:flagellar basal-body rod protein FlgF